MVSIDLHICHATRALSVSGTSGMTHLGYMTAWLNKKPAKWTRATLYSLYPFIHAYSWSHVQCHDWLGQSSTRLNPHYVNVLCPPDAWSSGQAPAPLYALHIVCWKNIYVSSTVYTDNFISLNQFILLNLNTYGKYIFQQVVLTEGKKCFRHQIYPQ
jgi:hypothetical protein